MREREKQIWHTSTKCHALAVLPLAKHKRTRRRGGCYSAQPERGEGAGEVNEMVCGVSKEFR
jgi:hypothetical protein